MTRGTGRTPASAWMPIVVLAAFAGGCSDAGHVATIDRWRVSPGDSSHTREVRLPIHFTSDDIPDDETHYLLTTTVRLPRALHGRRAWFVQAQLPARTALRVDGRDATAVVDEPWETVWVSGPQIFAVPASATADGVLHLEWRIDHNWPLGRWVDRTPEIRRVGSIGRASLLTQTTSFYVATILLGALLAAAVSCLAALLVDRRDADNAWMLGTAISALPFALFQAGILQRIVPHRYEFAFTLITLSFACFCLGRFFAHRHGLVVDVRPWAVAFATSVIMAFAMRDRPFSSAIVQESLGSICDMLAVLPPTLALVRGRATRNQDDVALTKVVLVLALLLSIPDMLYFMGVGDFFGGGHSVMLGVLVVATTNVQLLARKRTRELSRANDAVDAHATELREEERRLGLLASELATQMNASPSRLLDAVAAISSKHVPQTNLAPGDVVDDRYRVVRRLGVGGMGSVFEVERTSDRARFALKTAHELDGTSLARLAREALIGANVESESIIEVVDIGIAKQGFLFLVMEFFESRPLSDSSARFGDVDWGVRVLGKVASALHTVHEAGVVHRDLKPSNVLLGRDDESIVKLADFGISRFANEEAEKDSSGERLTPISIPPPPPDESVAPASDDEPAAVAPPRTTTPPDSLPDLTIAGQIAGTVGFMAPEVMTSEIPTRAWDVYAFGVIAYSVLTGRRPVDPSSARFRGQDPDEPASPALVDCVEGVDRALLAVLDACRSVDPRARPTSEAIVLAFERAGV